MELLYLELKNNIINLVYNKTFVKIKRKDRVC